MNEPMQQTIDDPLNAYGYAQPIPYNNMNYPYAYDVKNEPNYHPPLMEPQTNYPQYPSSSFQSVTEEKKQENTYTANNVTDSKNEDVKPKITTRLKKLKGKTSSYWNKKIEDKDFKFFGCAICNTSYKDLNNLDGHITTEHNSERLSSYDLRKLNKLKNKGKKKKGKKTKGKKIKQESGFEIEIKPEDGYIGNEKATEFTENNLETDDKSSILPEKVADSKENDKKGEQNDENQKIEKIYKCFGCNKLFAMSYYLRLHVRSHTGEKPYSCKVCGESFITASKLGRHNKRVHLSVKHQCRICFRQFSRFELLTAHFDKRHLEDKLEGEVYDYFAILPYMKELEEELKLKMEAASAPKQDSLWPDDGFVPPDEKFDSKSEVKVEIEAKVEEQEQEPTDQIEGILVEEVKVYYPSDDEVKVKVEADEAGDEQNVEPVGDDAFKDDRDSFSDEDYFPSNTWAASPKIEPEPSEAATTKCKRNSDGSQTCEICNKVIKTAHYMVIHMRTHTGEKPYKCYICDRGFITASKMNRHVLTHSDDERKIYIENGTKVGAAAVDNDIKTSKKPHKRQKNQNPAEKKSYRKRQYYCDYCSQSFSFKDTLQVHLKSHEGQNLIYKCRFCLEIMPDKSSLDEHSKQHSGPRPYLCTICGKQYIKRETMVYHRKGHESSNNFACDICSKTFKAKCQLRRHLAAHAHTKYILRYECPVCAHMFNTKYHIQMHLHTHQKEGLIVEENRNEILAMVLQNARKIPKQPETPLTLLPPPPEDDRSRICNICGEIFTHFYYLEEHLKSHGTKILLLNEDTEENKKYICKVCNKGFKLHYYLKLHSFTHTKERPYICQQCGKGFITKGKLKRHIETHSGWKKYQCHICYKFFTRPSYLRIHIRTIHGTQDYNFRLDKSFASESLDHGQSLPMNP